MDNNEPNTNKRYMNNEKDAYPLIEACLFAAGHPLTYERLGEVLDISADEAKKLIEGMASNYNTPDKNRGIMLVMYPDSCQLTTVALYAEDIKKALGIRRGGNLSKSLLEVLAVIAYNQPVTRAYIDAVRGVDSGYSVNVLLEKELIEVCGKLDSPGKPSLFKTTDSFLRVFGLSSLDELPTVSLNTETKSESGSLEIKVEEG